MVSNFKQEGWTLKSSLSDFQVLYIFGKSNHFYLGTALWI